MSDNFQQTVNLKERFRRRATNSTHANENMKRRPGATGAHANERFRRPGATSQPAQAGAVRQTVTHAKMERETYKKPQTKVKPKRRAEEIDQVYNNDHENIVEHEDLRKINMPKISRVNDILVKRIVLFLAAVIILGALYFLFLNKDNRNEPTEAITPPKWYAVKIVTGEVFYGQISDVTSDPIVINNVYYNYDQAEEGDTSTNSEQGRSEVSNLRLVKRGKETHGPEGIMNIVRSQVVYMESLKEDSKVLRAILDYER